jgi:hypothetical protein
LTGRRSEVGGVRVVERGGSDVEVADGCLSEALAGVPSTSPLALPYCMCPSAATLPTPGTPDLAPACTLPPAPPTHL